MNDAPLIFCAYVPAMRPRERAPAMAAITALGDRWPLVLWECHSQDDYSRGLAAYWHGRHTLINIEHDHAPTPAQIAEIIACPHPACTLPYWMSPVTTGRGACMLSIDLRLVKDDLYPRQTAIGMIKIAPSKRREQFPIVRYHDVEYHVNRLCRPPWHVHGPPWVRHYHGFWEDVPDARHDKRQYLVGWGAPIGRDPAAPSGLPGGIGAT